MWCCGICATYGNITKPKVVSTDRQSDEVKFLLSKLCDLSIDVVKFIARTGLKVKARRVAIERIQFEELRWIGAILTLALNFSKSAPLAQEIKSTWHTVIVNRKARSKSSSETVSKRGVR